MSKKIIFAIGIPMLVLTAALFVLLQPQEAIVARLDGQSISLTEYYVYLYEQKLLFESRGGADIWEMDFGGETSEEVAKQNALYSLELVKLSARQAKKTGISLTSSEKSEAADYAGQVYEQMEHLPEDIGLSLHQLIIIMEENDLYRKIFDATTSDYVFDENEFNKYYAEYFEANKDYLEGYINIEQIYDTMKQEYVDEKKFEIYLSRYNEWFKNNSAVKNTQIWNKISINDLN